MKTGAARRRRAAPVRTFSNGYSGLQPVDDLLITGFNILMTNWFILFYSIYD